MAKNNNLTDFVTDLADAIRAKCKTTGPIDPQDFSAFVGGMPFFKLRETVDITGTSDNAPQIPLSYDNTYVKGYVYLTNDNGLTDITGVDEEARIMMSGNTAKQLASIKNTRERVLISGYQSALPFKYVSFLNSYDGGYSLEGNGWHIKIDIYELCMGNPNGEYTKIDLNNATGGGV